MSTTIIPTRTGPTPDLTDYVQVGELSRTPRTGSTPAQDSRTDGASAAPPFGSAGRFDTLRELFAKTGAGEAASQPAADPYAEAIATNEAIRQGNADIDKQIAALEEEAQHLRTLLMHTDSRGDGVLTWSELENLSLNSSSEDVRAAATWMLGHPEVYDSLPRKWTLIGGDTDASRSGFSDGAGIDVNRAAIDLADLARQVSELKSERREEVPVPPNPALGAVAGVAAGVVGGATGSVQAGASSTPVGAGRPAGASAMEQAMSSLGGAMDSLQAQIAEEAEKAASSDPKVSGPAQRRFQLLTQQLQQVTAMMNTLTTMMSNLAKLYSEMAMTSVRNMK